MLMFMRILASESLTFCNQNIFNTISWQLNQITSMVFSRLLSNTEFYLLTQLMEFGVFKLGFYAQLAPEAISRARAYSHNLYTHLMMHTLIVELPLPGFALDVIYKKIDLYVEKQLKMSEIYPIISILKRHIFSTEIGILNIRNWLNTRKLSSSSDKDEKRPP